jgi:hypothetical protein
MRVIGKSMHQHNRTTVRRAAFFVRDVKDRGAGGLHGGSLPGAGHAIARDLSIIPAILCCWVGPMHGDDRLPLGVAAPTTCRLSGTTTRRLALRATIPPRERPGIAANSISVEVVDRGTSLISATLCA